MSETNQKKGGRPRVDATPVTVRIPPDQMKRIDLWIEQQDAPVSRPEAIRQLVERALGEGHD